MTSPPRSIAGLTAVAAGIAIAISGSASPATAAVPAHVAAVPRTLTTVAPTKVLTVLEENHSLTQMLTGMPYLASLATKYSYASDWTAVSHPSLPNYLAIVGGSTFGVSNDSAPSVNAAKVGSAKSVFDQAIAAGKTAKTYAESMPSNCGLVTVSPYAVKHNPWAYFGSSATRANCTKFDVSTATLQTAESTNTLPNAGFVVPNLANDAHNGTLATADTWLKTNLAKALASTDFTSGRLVIVVTCDEGTSTYPNDKVLTVVMHAGTAHRVVSTLLSHYSLTRYYAQVLGSTPLAAGAKAPDMKAAFGL
jgi:phosphatidylinositol-3-phosphatase